MESSSRAQERRTIALLAGVALAAVILALVTTRWGAGIAPDSVVYIGAARSMLHGGGLTLPFGGVEDAPNAEIEVHKHAPLFPLLLATIGLLGLDPLDGARWLNALLFGTNTFLTGYAVYRYTRSRLATIVGTLLMMSSVDMLFIHTTALTEPLFIFFELTALILLASFIERGKSLVIASIVVGLGFLTRYPGVALIITGLVGILFLTRADYRAKARGSFVFLIGAGLPMVLWFVSSFYVGRNPIGREIVFRPLAYRHIEPALSTFGAWLVPAKLPGVPPLARTILLCGIVTLALVVLIGSWSERKKAGGDGSGPRGLERLPTLSLIFIVAYFWILVVSLAFIPDFWLKPDVGGRHQSPVYVSLLIVSLCFGYRTLRSATGERTLRAATGVLCVFLLGTYVVRGTVFVSHRYSEGSGYLNTGWRQSETIEWIKTLPTGVQLYSNGPDAIYFLTGRSAVSIPWKLDKVTGHASADLSSRLSQMADRLREGNSFLVLFDAINWRGYFPSEDELRRLLPLTLVTRKSDGSVYEMR
jgi:4-amino-4-deoxy-L-arabinose transferase-like glycosyltransferase